MVARSEVISVPILRLPVADKAVKAAPVSTVIVAALADTAPFRDRVVCLVISVQLVFSHTAMASVPKASH